MGLMQKAVETYHANEKLVGVYREGREPLAPVGHTLTSANVEITLNRDGRFVAARRVDKSEPKILIPVTEDSGGRSGTKAYKNPHPLCDQFKYYSASENFFLPQLEEWAQSQHTHPFLSLILTYLKRNTLRNDLERTIGQVKDDDFICWRVIGIEEEEPACWKNKNLMLAFVSYYQQLLRERMTGLCMIEGAENPITTKHPKGIIPINGNAKLISANDSSGFTYRGRFSEDWQAATVGYVASQKAHNALRWLASEQGVREFSGNRIFLCWNPQGKQLLKPMRRIRSSDASPIREPREYQTELKSTLLSFRKDHQLKDTDTAVLTAFDAATTGRLAVTYYNELSLGLFLERMWLWDAHCCWNTGQFGIQAPNLLQLVDCAYGTQRGNFLETDPNIQRQHLQRLLDCKVSGGVLPADILKNLTRRASTPLAYDDAIWRRILHAACSALQKYRFDTNQGGNEMSWELDKKNRSFQFGRLLAVMERAEADYYWKTQETRQTNAIKFMSEFRQRPFFVFERINRHLQQAYLSRIEPWQVSRYNQLVGEIFAIISEFPENELNKPLDDLYLMGYTLQRNAFYAKKENEKNETEE